MRMLPLAIILALATPLPADEFVVNEATTGTQIHRAAVSTASDGGGNFVVVWLGADGTYGNYGIWASRFDAGTLRRGPDVLVNSFTTGRQIRPAVAVHPDGRFVVVWHDEARGIFGQRFDALGAPLGGEFQVNTSVPPNFAYADVAGDATGRFVVVWTARDGSGYGVLAQVFSADGTPDGGEFMVNSATAGALTRPAVAMHAGGAFVAAWSGRRPDGSNGIAARRFEANGVPVGLDFNVSEGEGMAPHVEIHPAGGFLAVWWGSDLQVRARDFDAAYQPIGPSKQISGTVRDSPMTGNPSVAVGPSGTFMITYETVDDEIMALHYERGLSFSRPVRVDESPYLWRDRPAVAATGADGQFVVTWTAFNPGPADSDVLGRKIRPRFYPLPR